MATRKRSRGILTAAMIALIGAALAYAFWPRPLLVDIGTVTSGPMMQTIDEEGRTRVHDLYVVSTPIAGRLERVDVHPGDTVLANRTVLARMLPTNPAVLDLRTREQAQAAVAVAEAMLRVATADVNKALADKALSDSDLERTRTLAARGTVSQATLDRAEAAARLAAATLDTARAAVTARRAEVQNAKAQLISFDDPGLASAANPTAEIPLHAPADGTVLRIVQQSETTLPVGTPILEIGDIASDLEIEVQLLSTDAVQVRTGHRVLIEDWGGNGTLNGVVSRIEPWGYTKTSALGVEEQRVRALVEFTDPPETRPALGHGFRVELRIVIWEAETALRVPSNALFRQGDGWAVFIVDGGRARLAPVRIGHDNGIMAEVLDGLSDGADVVLYPSPQIADGTRVAQRQID